MARQDIYAEIEAEPEHPDDEHGPADWAALIFDRANRVMKITGPHVALPVTASGYRRYLIEIAALAVAAVEAFDREQREEPSR